METSNGDDDEKEKKKFKDIWHNANLKKHVVPFPAIADAIIDAPDMLLP